MYTTYTYMGVAIGYLGKFRFKFCFKSREQKHTNRDF